MCPKVGNRIDLWTLRSVTWEYSKEYSSFLILFGCCFFALMDFFWTLIWPQKTYNPVPRSSIKAPINSYEFKPIWFFSYAFLMPIVGSYFNIHGYVNTGSNKMCQGACLKAPSSLIKVMLSIATSPLNINLKTFPVASGNGDIGLGSETDLRRQSASQALKLALVWTVCMQVFSKADFCGENIQYPTFHVKSACFPNKVLSVILNYQVWKL